ncbi:MAG: YrdB family protein [Nocardioidaceae bacterium]
MSGSPHAGSTGGDPDRHDAPDTDDPPIGPLALVRLISELVMLVALGYVGWELGTGVLTSLPLAIVLPVAAAVTWGRWVAPRATRRLEDPARLGVELVVFGVTAAGLVWVGSWAAAVVLAVLYAVGTPHGRAGG